MVTREQDPSLLFSFNPKGGGHKTANGMDQRGLNISLQRVHSVYSEILIDPLRSVSGFKLVNFNRHCSLVPGSRILQLHFAFFAVSLCVLLMSVDESVSYAGGLTSRCHTSLHCNGILDSIFIVI